MLRKVKTKKTDIVSSREMSNILAGACPIPCGCENCGTYESSLATLTNSKSTTYRVIDPPTGG